MSLTVTFRPQKDLYVNNPPDAYDTSYYNSRWVSGHLPIQYKIANTKWPVNTEDDVDNICAVTDANGFVQINLCGTYETYNKYDYITIADSTVSSYNGVWQILSDNNDTTVTIGAVYAGTATGTIQKYYNGYKNLIKVYAGIPQYHQFQSEDPMSLIGTRSIKPNSSNISIVDISGLIQDKLNCDNDFDQISGANDLNAWTGFYIEYAESYDTSDGATITTFTSAYTTDNNVNCNAEQIIQNGDFTTDLTGWVNGGSGATFIYDSATAAATKGGESASKVLYQEAEFLQGVEYNIMATAINGEANALRLFITLYTDTSLTTGINISTEFITGTQVINFNYIPSKDYSVIGFRFFYFGTTAQKGSLDNISATISDCTYYGFALNGTRQFQNTIGGNFGDYVQNFNEHVYLNKFLTYFTSPIWFNGLKFDLSTIIPKSSFDSTEDGNLYYYIKEYTEGGGFIQRQDITLASKDDGLYRLPISDLTLDSDTENFDVQIYQLPTNKMTQGNGGTFEYTVDSAGSPPSDWALSRGALCGALERDSATARTGTYSLEANFGGSITTGQHTVWETTGGFTVQENSDYIIEGWIRFQSTITAFANTAFALVPIGITETLRESQTYTDAIVGTWLYVRTVFNTGANTSVDIKAILTVPSSRTGGGLIFYDDITVKGPVENLSEIKNVTVDNSCTKQNIYMTWLNNLGRYEYYNFTAEKDYGIDVTESTSIKRDIFNNWDTGFINGETEDDFINIKAAEKVTVRSQFMSLDEINAVKTIKYAIRAQVVRSDNTKITVMVDKGSFKVRSDGDKLYQIQFDITYPGIQIQTQ